jgi:predicted P-loop ATPase
MSLFGDLDIASAADDPFALKDGTYAATITKCSVQDTSDGEGKGFTLEYTAHDCDDESMEGRKQSEWLTIPQVVGGEFVDREKGPTHLSFLKRRLRSLGVPEDQMNSVEPDDVLDLEVFITVKRSGDYVNIKKLVLADDSATGFEN